MDQGAIEGAIDDRAVDQGAIEAAMGAASDGSGSNGRCDFVQVMHQRAVEGATDGASDGSESNRWSDGCCKLWIYGCYKRLIRLKS